MSDEKEPVAWHVTGNGYEYSTLLEEHARAVAKEEDGTVTPLYELPTLTAAEREAIDDAAYLCETTVGMSDERGNATAWATCAATLRGLLERIGGAT
jgi:hypothetical protein